MKIVLVTPNYPPAFIGGIERVVQAEARELHHLGHEVKIISGLVDGLPAGQDTGGPVLRTEEEGVEVGPLAELDSKNGTFAAGSPASR